MPRLAAIDAACLFGRIARSALVFAVIWGRARIEVRIHAHWVVSEANRRQRTRRPLPLPARKRQAPLGPECQFLAPPRFPVRMRPPRREKGEMRGRSCDTGAWRVRRNALRFRDCHSEDSAPRSWPRSSTPKRLAYSNRTDFYRQSNDRLHPQRTPGYELGAALFRLYLASSRAMLPIRRISALQEPGLEPYRIHAEITALGARAQFNHVNAAHVDSALRWLFALADGR
jgi:hypothetical protein